MKAGNRGACSPSNILKVTKLIMKDYMAPKRKFSLLSFYFTKSRKCKALQQQLCGYPWSPVRQTL